MLALVACITVTDGSGDAGAPSTTAAEAGPPNVAAAAGKRRSRQLAPRIVVTSTSVSINGKHVAPRDELAPSPGVRDERTVKPIVVHLEQMHERWTKTYAADTFAPAPRVYFPADIATSTAAKLLRSIIRGGYRSDITVHVDGVSLTFDSIESMSWYYGKPMNYASPPSADAILHFDGTAWQLSEWRGSGGIRWDARRFMRACTAPRTVDATNAREALSALCASWCRTLMVDDPSEFRHAARFVADILTEQRSFRSIDFGADDLCSLTPPPPMGAPLPTTPVALPPSASPAARLVVLSASGALASEQIEPVVQTHLHVLRACYARGLAMDPHLRGTISLSFEIDTDGAMLFVQEHSRLPPVGPVDVILSDEGVVSCVVHSFADVRFAASAAGRSWGQLTTAFSPK